MSGDRKDDRAALEEDLELRPDEAALVKGGMLPIEGGGDGLILAAPTVGKKRKKRKKKKSTRRFSPGGGRPAP